MLSSLSNCAIIFSEYFYLKNHPKKYVPSFHSHFRDKREFHHCFSLCLHHYFFCRDSSKTFLYWRNVFQKILISLKWRTFNIKHYLHKNYLHKRFILAYIRIWRKKTVSRIVLKKLDFVELSIQAKYLRVWILHDDWQHDSPSSC